MKRTALSGLVALTVLSAAACSPQESSLGPAPIAVTEASPVATTPPPTAPPTTAPATTVPPPTVPDKPVVTALPVVVPIAKQEVVPPTTPSPENPDTWSQSFANPTVVDNSPIQVGWVSIPKIGLSRATFAPRSQNSQSALDRAVNQGPTYWGNQVLPGQEGNSILTGHRTSHGGPFRNIDQLVAGDEIHVTGFDGVPHVYVVESQAIIYPDETWWQAPRGGATLTLYSCHPPTSIRQRILVFARLRT